ncbi:MAG: sulfite oxidase heme-binding subunit YedZ [Brevefilum sp.]
MGKKNQKDRKNKSQEWIQWIVHIAGWLPIIVLFAAYLTDYLGFNPIESVLRWTGRLAFIFLLLSLTCTPAHKIFAHPSIYRLRKPLGLYSALYAGLHFAVFAIWDYRLDFSLIWHEIRNKPFIIFGLIALVILLVLAATSFNTLRRKLGKTWNWLHRLVYAAVILSLIHYLLAIKGDLSSLQGAYAPPLIAAGILILLILLRIPKIHQALRHILLKE